MSLNVIEFRKEIDFFDTHRIPEACRYQVVVGVHLLQLAGHLLVPILGQIGWEIAAYIDFIKELPRKHRWIAGKPSYQIMELLQVVLVHFRALPKLGW